MKEIVFIINPISGTQDKSTILRLMNESIDKKQYNPQVIYTERAGHATEIAREAAEKGVDVVVAVGGDGTVNEVGRSLIHTQTALGIIPCGSGNGLARHLEIPLDIRGAIEVLNANNMEQIDYGKINDIPFFCTCGVGFDAFVSLKFANSGKRGLMSYLEKTLQESLSYKPETYELETPDGTVKHKAFLIACANASQYGNNAYIAPQARLTDGLLDVTILEPFTVLDVPSLSFQLFNKTIDQNSRIKTFKCSKLCIHRHEEGVAHFDGDPIITQKDVNVEIIQKGLSILVPESKKEKDAGLLQKAATEVIEGLKPIGDSIVEEISDANRRILVMNKRLLKKLTKM